MNSRLTQGILRVGSVIAIMIITACSPEETHEKTITTLESIRAKREISCGYLVYSPYIRRDAQTGELSGIFYDIMEQIGKNADLKIRWAEEVGYQNIMPGLDAKRYDVFCGGLYPSSSRALADTKLSKKDEKKETATQDSKDDKITKIGKDRALTAFIRGTIS